ncbi:MAG: MaoC family dehydratase [Bernardetiaceae bacterium]|jgi:acyl dehydratase|nr:MaoC family dehydratase [Bernardetiaceae bacterium]
MPLEPQTVHRHRFIFSQAEVEAFAQVTGDHNPLHLDAAFAQTTQFKRPIVHGMLGASVFSRVMGMEFPGPGSIYLSQTLQFKRPMYVGEPYEAVFTVLQTDLVKRRAVIQTQIFQAETGKIAVDGQAEVLYPETA